MHRIPTSIASAVATVLEIPGALPDGSISTLAAGTARVEIMGVDTVVHVVRALSGVGALAVNDVVIVIRPGPVWYIADRTGVATPPPAPPPSTPSRPPAPRPKPTTITGTTVITPVETRSYRPTYDWRFDNNDIYQGSYGGWGNHHGCMFYGNKPRALAGATVTKATVKFFRPSGTGETWGQASTRLWLISNKTRPAGAPTRQGLVIAGPRIAAGKSVTFTIPDSWGQALVNGSSGGLALFQEDGKPYLIFAGRGRWSPAGTLTISWTKSS